MREDPKKYGDKSEDLATAFLEQEGFIILERNYFARKLGEIDIIAQRDDVLHFIEVKSGDDYEKAIQNITPTKLSRLIKTANVYMKKNSYDGDFQLDAVVVTSMQIELVENITL